jgi:hypothetical protein
MMTKRLALIMIMMMIITAGMALYAQSPRAHIRDIRGTVEVKGPGSPVWEAATEGLEVRQETLISTGFNSSALIGIGNSTILVRPLTRLSVGAIQAAAEGDRVEVQLRAGRIRANVKAPAGGAVAFTVRSPTATASVRGTVFDFDTVNLTVEEGRVSFSGADNTAVYVAAGQSSSPDPVSGRTSAPVEAAAASVPLPPAGSGEAAAATGGTDVTIPTVVITPEPVPDPIPEPAPVTDAPVDVGITWK